MEKDEKCALHADKDWRGTKKGITESGSAYSIRGDKNAAIYKKELENLCTFCGDNAVYWCIIGPFQPKWNGGFSGKCDPANAVSTDDPVSNRLDGAVYSDGCGCGAGLFRGSKGRQKPVSKLICGAAHTEFLLEPDFFQRRGLWLCLFVAATPFGACDLDGGLFL